MDTPDTPGKRSVGRPKVADASTRKNFYLDDALCDRLEGMAIKSGRSMSDIVRQAVENQVNAMENVLGTYERPVRDANGVPVVRNGPRSAE